VTANSPSLQHRSTGQWGWEMVNYTIDERSGVTIQAFFKRHLKP
jgi:hypothetical protein